MTLLNEIIHEYVPFNHDTKEKKYYRTFYSTTLYVCFLTPQPKHKFHY